ncbi:unnamed protein product, partial [Prorocentrum cordatum]
MEGLGPVDFQSHSRPGLLDNHHRSSLTNSVAILVQVWDLPTISSLVPWHGRLATTVAFVIADKMLHRSSQRELWKMLSLAAMVTVGAGVFFSLHFALVAAEDRHKAADEAAGSSLRLNLKRALQTRHQKATADASGSKHSGGEYRPNPCCRRIVPLQTQTPR